MRSPGSRANCSTNWAIPDLIIIDGGKGQLHAAMEVMEELQLDIPIIGFAKDEGSHSKLATSESIFLPGSSEPIMLPRTSQSLYMLQRIRDEAHRFGITYHRKVRSERTFKSVLDEIPGNWGQSVNRPSSNISARFGPSVAASVDELAALDGMTRDAAEKVKEYIGRVE